MLNCLIIKKTVHMHEDYLEAAKLIASGKLVTKLMVTRHFVPEESPGLQVH